MTTVSSKSPWDEALLLLGEGVDSHTLTSGVLREERMLYPRYLGTFSVENEPGAIDSL